MNPYKNEIIIKQNESEDENPLDIINEIINQTDDKTYKKSNSIHKNYQNRETAFNDYYEQNGLDIISEEESTRYTVINGNLSKKFSINGICTNK